MDENIAATARLTLGADPERFIFNESGELVPVCGWLGGTKKNPVPLGPGLNKLFVQEDNIMAEYNIPPASNREGFARSIQTAEKYLLLRVRDTNAGYYVSTACSAIVSNRLVATTLGADMFGCSAEFDAYTEGGEVPTPRMRMVGADEYGEPTSQERYAGGHLHLGITVNDEYVQRIPRYVLAALCDASIGLCAAPHDKQGGRRAVYGQAGRFRPTKYGIEYRVLSNFWTNDPMYSMLVADAAFRVMRFVAQEKMSTIHSVFDDIPWGAVREAINTEDAAAAHALYSHIWNELTGRIAA